MVKATRAYREFEIDQLRQSLTLEQRFRILDGLWREACHLGVLPDEEPLRGIEVDIDLARALRQQGCSKSS